MQRLPLVIIAALVYALPVQGAVISVDNSSDTFSSTAHCTDAVSGNCTLREAITLANAQPGADTLQLQPLIYNLSIPAGTPDDSTTGDLDITEEVTIETVPTLRATIDGGGSGGTFLDRIFHVHALSGQVQLRRLDIKGGFVGLDTGGGILVDTGGNALVDDCTVTGNAAGAGGGLYVSSGAALQLDLTTVAGNYANGFAGGGIDCAGTLTIDRSTFDGNQGGVGGGLRVSLGCSASISKSTVSNNSATNTFWGASGGGILVGACGVVTLDNVTISGNNAKGSGGGIVTAAAYGFCAPGTVLGNNVTLAFNKSDSDANSSGDGGGIYNGGDCSVFPNNCVKLQNSIVNGNKDNTTANDCAGNSILSGGYNMLNTTLCPASSLASDLGTDPQLVPTLQANSQNWTGIDNPTKTHGLIAGSPAVNSGNGATCETTDQRGVARIGTCDRGAFEADICGTGGDNVARAPEECDPPSATCTASCRISQATVHNTPYVTDVYKVGLLVAYQRCDVPLPGLVDPNNSLASCNVASADPAGACEFDSAVSTAKGFVEVDPSSASGGKIDFHLKLQKLIVSGGTSCLGRQFQLKVSLDETLEFCAATGKSCVIQKDLLEDLVLTGDCTVQSTGTCEFTTTWNGTSSPHKVANAHRVALEVRSVKVVNKANGADAFVPGVLLK